jgi:hypothetical protein
MPSRSNWMRYDSASGLNSCIATKAESKNCIDEMACSLLGSAFEAWARILAARWRLKGV